MPVAVRFEPIPWSHGWKVLDWQRGVYVPRLWDTERQAKRYAQRRNSDHRKATAPRYVIGPGATWQEVPPCR